MIGLPRQLAQHGHRLTSIPLAIFAGIIGLFLTGNTINIMTLGGLALAIGMLVDDATVTVENVHRNQSLGKPLTVAILDGAHEVIQPLTVATLAICIVFFPVVLLFGVARYLFIPLAATVVFCMLASYALSFTVVPSFARLLLASEPEHHGPQRGFFGVFDRGFGRFRDFYGRSLEGVLRHRVFVLACAGALLVVSGGLTAVIGLDFFPECRCRADQAALPGPGGHPHRADGTTGAEGRGPHPADHPSGGARNYQRHRGRAVVVQHGLCPDG